MKSLVWLLLLLSALTVTAIAYTVFRGYTICFWLRPGAAVLINGTPVSGSVHQSSRAVIITRRDGDLSHSYIVLLRESIDAPVLDCRNWIAPQSPILLSNHQNPLCFFLTIGDSEKSVRRDAPAGNAQVTPEYIEIRTHTGDVIRIKR